MSQDVSVYGTAAGFRGHAKPGSSILLNAAGEYSLTRHWVLALDAIYRHQGNTPVNGYNLANPALPILLNSGSSDAFGLAPAIEYNLNSKLGYSSRHTPVSMGTQHELFDHARSGRQLRPLIGLLIFARLRRSCTRRLR